MKTLLALLLPFIFCIISCNRNIEFPDNTSDLLKYYSRNGEKELGSPLSGAFLIAKGDSILFKGGVIGKTNVNRAESIDADTKFYIGSISKQFTACLILQLAEEGLLKLDDSISRYLPGFPKEKGDEIRIYQLLSHTSGLPHYPAILNHGYTKASFFNNTISVDTYVELIGKLKLIHPPGSEYAYSSFGYVLLGAIIERVTGQTYGEALKMQITEKLNLSNTGYSEEIGVDGFAPDQKYIKGKLLESSRFDDVPERDLSTSFAAGGIYSSINDLLIWARALQNGKLLSPKYQELMFSPVKKGVCYGLYRNPEEFLRDDQNVQLYYHGGGIMGYRSGLALYDDGVIVICLFNTLPLKRRTQFMNQLHLSALNKSKRTKHYIHPSLRNLKHFEHEGGLTAFDNYHVNLSEKAGYPILPSSYTMSRVVEMHLKGNKTDDIYDYVLSNLLTSNDLPEQLINQIGYAFLEAGAYKQAISIFEENTQRYPTSPNVYDSLGEAFENKNDLEKARSCYEKAVELAQILDGDDNLHLYKKNLDRVSGSTE